jgi:DNA-binding CsgD family transcriptional regulator
MADLPPGGLQIAADIAEIVHAPGKIEQRAEALLAPLHRLVPFEGAVIFLLDPDRGTAVPVVSRGYDEAVSGFITSAANTEEIELLGLTRHRGALRVGDLPVPREQVRGWVDYVWPAGFREGLAVGLFTPEGRYLGLLGLNTDTVEHPTAAARDLISTMAPAVARAVDPLRSVAAVAGIVSGAYAGIVLTRSGTTLALSGLPGHSLLVVGSDLLAVVAQRVTGGGAYGSFLWRVPAEDARNRHARITMLNCPGDSPQHLVAVVLMSPPGDVRGLTHRELEILGLIVEGWPNRRIAAALFITARTVATHVEHILPKLSTPTRTLAAVRALRLGLYVPPILNDIR